NDQGCNHYNTLPHRLAAKLPWFRLLIKMICIHTFINHAGYLHITAQGRSSNAVICFTFLDAKNARWKSKGKALNAHAKKLCRQEMPQLMNKHQNKQCRRKNCQR